MYESKWLVLVLLGAGLTGCGGGSSDAPPPTSGPNPPAPVPAPAPAPAPVPEPAPAPPPPPASTVPPLSATVIDLDDNHTVGTPHWPTGATAAGATGQVVQGLECLPTMPETYHVHTHLSIFLNGEALAVPGEVGIVEGSADCFYSIHTHEMSGKLHIEAAAPGTFTLGQFFALWGQPLENTNIAGLVGLPVVVYVTDNGLVTEATGDWHAIELTSHREVTIQVGTPITEIPNFTWSAH